MNFVLLALAIFAACLALFALSTILRVAVGQVRWRSSFALFAHAFYVAAFGGVAAWLFSLVFA